MYKYKKSTKTKLKVNTSYIGETIEQKINRILNNKEPITDGAPLIYTERKNGVEAQYDIRTDRFEIAVEAMDKVQKTHLAKREERAKVVPIEQQKTEKDSKAEPTAGTTTPEEGKK